MARANAQSVTARAVRKGCSPSLYVQNVVARAIAPCAKERAEREVRTDSGPKMRSSSVATLKWIAALTTQATETPISGYI
jgi:hypothetical protein